MQGFRYIDGVASLRLDAAKCTGCRRCLEVCPHAVFAADGRVVRIVDLDACIECGACARNCASGAVSVKPGVGCASAIINSWVFGGEPSCGCSSAPGPGEAAAPAGACCGGGSGGSDAGSPNPG